MSENNKDINKEQIINIEQKTDVEAETYSAKMANLLFFIVICLFTILSIFVSLLAAKNIKMGTVPSLIISELVIFVPGLIFYVILNSKKQSKRMFTKIPPLCSILFLVFTWLVTPLVTFANVLSQLFTTNAVMDASGEVLKVPFVVSLLIIGIYGPFCEEFVFRGVIYRNLAGKTGRYLVSGVVSAMFFGFMHMNLNQMGYAFILGVVFALINEIFESMWPSFICHAWVNSQNVAMLYLTDAIMSRLSGMGLSEYSTDSLMAGNMDMKVYIIVASIFLLIVSLFTTVLAGLLLYGMSILAGKKDRFMLVFSKKNSGVKERVLYPTGCIGIAVCIFVIFILDPLLNFLVK